MKKYWKIIFLFGVLYSVATFASIKKPQNAALDFTLSYKPQASTSTVEHVMKNEVKLAGDKWVVAGKMVNVKDNNVLLFMVREQSHHNNKYKLEFMLIDSGNHTSYVTMPHVAAMTGLPVKVANQEGDASIQLSVLVNMPTQS